MALLECDLGVHFTPVSLSPAFLAAFDAFVDVIILGTVSGLPSVESVILIR